MKLGVYSPVLMQNMYTVPEAALKHAYDTGITAMTIFGTELKDRRLKEYKEYVARYGIEICGIVQSAFLSDSDASARCREIDNVKEVIDEAVNCDVDNIMIDPQLQTIRGVSQVMCLRDKLYVRDTIVEGLNKIVEYAKNSGLTITIENFSLHTHPFSTVDEVLYMMQNVPGLKYTFDTGNFYCAKNDVLLAYRILKDYIFNMHIKDWISDEFGYCIRPELPALNGCIAGEGVLPLRKLMAELKSDCFDGTCVMELNTVSITQKDVEKTVEFVKQYL